MGDDAHADIISPPSTNWLKLVGEFTLVKVDDVIHVNIDLNPDVAH